ncbi:uncharacterized protein [Dermacentor albipictus]|uniref:uncharacterized protein isoform X1 n=1 Tax=Dermacentor albipictus TaxID=60249 RepID=UPI0031FCE783
MATGTLSELQTTTRMQGETTPAENMDATNVDRTEDGITGSARHNAGERQRTDDDWQTVLTLRQKKQQARERKRQTDSTGSTNPAKLKKRRRGIPKLPPLPKDDFKIVIRPHQGLPLKTISTPALAEAIVMACDYQIRGEQFLLRIKPGSNIAILSTSSQEVAEQARRVHSLTINGRSHDVNVYAATGEEAIRGVIHGLPPRTPPETIIANIRIRTQGVELIQARMIGETKSAALTFCGPSLPRVVYYNGGELLCHPYRATVQVCKTCHGKGHRTDVCPQPDLRVCRNCGLRNPVDGHPCEPKCASCEGAHVTGDRSCQRRLKQPKKPQVRKSTDKCNEGQKTPRWFASEDEESDYINGHRSDQRDRQGRTRSPSPHRLNARSRSASPHRSRSRSRARERVQGGEARQTRRSSREAPKAAGVLSNPQDFQGHVLNDPTKDLAEDIANHIASRPGGVSLRLPELLWLRRAACCSLALFPSPVPSQDLTRDENGWNQLSTLGTIPPIWWSR